MTIKQSSGIKLLCSFSIFSIILHSTWPNLFPHGFLGADVFFVISGYLITCTFSNLKTSLTALYLSQIKTIFPICLFVITVTILCGYYFLLRSHFLMLLSEAVWSIFFINNFSSIFVKETHFSFISDYKFLSHTWLLGIEIQFYLIAPFLYQFLNSRQKPLKWIFAGIILSAFLQLAFSIEFIFCRIWQYLIGSFSYYYTSPTTDNYSSEKIHKKRKQLYHVLLWGSLVAACLCKLPSSDNTDFVIVTILRLCVTVIAGVLIHLDYGIDMLQYTSAVLFYISDIFYPLYLFHWPIAVFFKYYGIFHGYYIFSTLMVTIFLSIILHEAFEKPLKSFSWTINGTILIVLYAIILTFKVFSFPYEKPDISVPFNTNMSSTYNAILANEMEALSCDDFHYPCDDGIFDFIPRNGKYIPYCSYNLDAESNKTAVIFGNSFAYVQSKGILTAIKSAKTKFNKVYLIIAFSCNALVGDLDINFKCAEAHSINSQFLKFLQPHLIIFSALLAQIKELRLPVPSLKEIPKHPNYPHLKSLLKYANYTKKFVIIEPTPASTMAKTYKTPLVISEALIAGKDLSLYKKNITAYENVDNNAWKWFEPVIEECKNCKIVTTRDIFCNEKECNFIDRKLNLGLYCDEGHTTPRTSFKLIPKLINAIDN